MPFFDAARPFNLLNSPWDEGQVAVTPRGDFLYFSSNRDGGSGRFDLYRSRCLFGEYLDPENLGAPVNGPHDDMDPAMILQGHGLVFSSDRALNAAGTRPYRLYRSVSREVLVRKDYSGLAGLLRVLDEIKWPLLILLLGILLLLLLLKYLMGQRTGLASTLLQRCLLASILLHILLALLTSTWMVTSSLIELMGEDEGALVLDLDALSEDRLALEIREEVADLEPAEAALPMETREEVLDHLEPQRMLAAEQPDFAPAELVDAQALPVKAVVRHTAPTPRPVATPSLAERLEPLDPDPVHSLMERPNRKVSAPSRTLDEVRDAFTPDRRAARFVESEPEAVPLEAESLSSKPVRVDSLLARADSRAADLDPMRAPDLPAWKAPEEATRKRVRPDALAPPRTDRFETAEAKRAPEETPEPKPMERPTTARSEATTKTETLKPHWVEDDTADTLKDRPVTLSRETLVARNHVATKPAKTEAEPLPSPGAPVMTRLEPVPLDLTLEKTPVRKRSDRVVEMARVAQDRMELAPVPLPPESPDVRPEKVDLDFTPVRIDPEIVTRVDRPNLPKKAPQLPPLKLERTRIEPLETELTKTTPEETLHEPLPDRLAETEARRRKTNPRKLASLEDKHTVIPRPLRLTPDRPVLEHVETRVQKDPLPPPVPLIEAPPRKDRTETSVTLKRFAHETPRTYHGLELRNRKLVFCLDVSMSMEWNDRIGDARNELLRLLDTLDEGVEFNIITFSGTVRVFSRDGVRPGTAENLEKAKRFVRRARIGSDGTNTLGALAAAFADEDAECVYFLSDGHPTTGPITDGEAILRWVDRAQEDRGLIINTIAYVKGLPPPSYRSRVPPRKTLIDLMRRLAEDNGGQFVLTE